VLTAYNKSKLVTGTSLYMPPTPTAILALLQEYNVNLAQHKILVVGQGQLVGKPLSDILNFRGIPHNIADDQTLDLDQLMQEATLIVSATGQANLITPNKIQSDVVLIDAGASEQSGKIKGDVSAEAYAKGSYVAPVPGGVGPVTVAILLINVVFAAHARLK
jgi:methylenetetrahydrofolate dehydrogenase (NADP+)/methenyltetrahydrofolate cyclohydrolase